MSSLFDLPFEEPEAGRTRAAVAAPRADRLRPQRPHPHASRRTVHRSLGRRRAVEQQGVEYRSHVLHAEGSRRPDSQRHVPVGAAPAALQAAGWPSRDRPRTNQRVRPEGRVPARVRTPRTGRAWRTPAGVRTAETAAAGGRAVRPAPQACAAGTATKDRGRDVARRCRRPRHHPGAAPALSECAHRHPSYARPGRGRGARYCASAGRDRTGAGRRRRHRRPGRRLDRGSRGPSTKKWWHERSRDVRSRRFRRSATRRT